MATSRSYPLCMARLVITVLMILIFSLSYLPSKSVGESSSSSSYMRRSSSAVIVDQLQQRKKVLGSRPPTCVNKCMSCRPCMATLVIPPHRIKTSSTTTTSTYAYQQSSSFHREDDSYYLLSWKCKCGDKLFQP